MKKLSFLLIALLMAIMANAQTEHLKFMGIPIDGTLDEFSNKLKNKGFIEGNLHPGARFFSGIFSGEEATVAVHFNQKNKIVHMAVVSFEYSSIDIAKSKLEIYNNMVKKKYSPNPSNIYESEEFGYPFYTYFLYDTNNILMGNITLYISNFQGMIHMHISYQDYHNYKLNQQSNIEDI